MKYILPVCVLCMLMGCAGQAQLTEANQRLDAQAQQLQKQESDIATLYLRLDAKGETPPIDQQQFYQDNQQLLAQVRQLQTQVQSLQSEVDRLSRDVVQLKGAPAPSTAAVSAPAQAGVDTSVYDTAREYYSSGRFNEAAELFREFLKKYPSHPLAANSQYWLGECFYSLDNFSAALNEFQKVIDFYADSPKAPDALVKIALTYRKQGRNAQAKLELERVGKLYPSYERMELVRSLLNEVQ